MESWIAHDPNSSPKDHYIKYQLEQGGKIIYSGINEAEVPHNSSKFQGFVKFKAPQVEERTAFVLRAAVFDGVGNSVDQTIMDIDVFPRPAIVGTSTIGFLGETSQTTTYLKNHFGNTVVPNWKDADVIWVPSYTDYETHKEVLEKLATSGKKVILYNVPVGDHNIGGTSVKVQNTSMGSYYFTSPQTGHRFTENAKPFDFKMWYDEEVDYITPFLDKIVLSDNWSPILSTGNTNWVEDHGAAMAAGELKIGEGSIIICQLDVNNRLKSNPVAHDFVEQLIFN
ncbi:hypothetical protein [Arenibacter latericius]|uniref:hypothetical protein n=1 Tax=Arenibacter latericius TaxID=86104 RepID=UPI00047B90C1|nr:hypothetical protein [Arenibacter latericius]